MHVMNPHRPSSLPPLRWFLPSFHGDILLSSTGVEGETSLRAFELSAPEILAVKALRTRALSRWKGKWSTSVEFDKILDPTGWKGEGTTITLHAPIAEVQAILSKALKPTRDLVTAVRFSDGRIEETQTYRTTPSMKETEENSAKSTGDDEELPTETERQKSAAERDSRRRALAKKDEPEVAVTLAKPVLGCPRPDFGTADVRASRVLEAFLTPEQTRDYRSRGAFITRGIDTGRRYLIAHRERPALLAQCGGRQLFDLEDRVPLCIHDWTVPPPEEMLALHLLLSMPGHELYVRRMPETFEIEGRP